MLGLCLCSSHLFCIADSPYLTCKLCVGCSVGSCIGVSNAQVAHLLNIPVLLIGKAGIGNAIDSINMMLAYFEKYQCNVLGACWSVIEE